ncbi:MAG: hypothetical protein E7614_03110 [Ruminococcaceae bacterium]|nr:hypothetical protein [Oscillospiraceae bacterium]
MSKIKNRIVLCVLLTFVVVFSCACDLVKAPDYYELNGDDVVTSFTKVVGDRKVNTKKIEMTNAVQTISYSYKNVVDAYGDAEKYIDFLTGEEDFYYNGMLNMDESEDEVSLSKTSPKDEEYEITVTVIYNVNTKVVKIVVEREKIIE